MTQQQRGSSAPGPAEPERLARQLWDEARVEGQAARTVASDRVAAEVRALVRDLSKAAAVRIRTARMDDRVVVVRLDAPIWQDDAATMRRKLTPPDD